MFYIAVQVTLIRLMPYQNQFERSSTQGVAIFESRLILKRRLKISAPFPVSHAPCSQRLAFASHSSRSNSSLMQ